MPGNVGWLPAEIETARQNLPYERLPAEFRAVRTRTAWRLKRHDLGLGVPRPEPPVVEQPPVPAAFSWRSANQVIEQFQTFRQSHSFSADEAVIRIAATEPIGVVCLSDMHIGSWGTEHGLLERITDEIIEHDLYVILLGDLIQLAIKLRSVAEVGDNLLPPELQYRYLESWLDEIKERVIAATWGNHEAREEGAAGTSRIGAILGERRIVYHAGIGNFDLHLGEQTYKFVVSHHFQGRSIYNPVHGAQRYLVMEGHDREIAACGDSHVPGLLTFVHGGVTKVAINTGSVQTNSRYGKRYFSLTTAPVFPCLELDPAMHRVTPYWSVAGFLRATRRHPELQAA